MKSIGSITTALERGASKWNKLAPSLSILSVGNHLETISKMPTK